MSRVLGTAIAGSIPLAAGTYTGYALAKKRGEDPNSGLLTGAAAGLLGGTAAGSLYFLGDLTAEKLLGLHPLDRLADKLITKSTPRWLETYLTYRIPVLSGLTFAGLTTAALLRYLKNSRKHKSQ